MNDCQSLFNINGSEVQGVFSSQGLPFLVQSGIWIGGRFGRSQALKGGISALEIYVGSKSRLPDVIKNLIISSQMIKGEVKEEEEPNQIALFSHVAFVHIYSTFSAIPFLLHQDIVQNGCCYRLIYSIL